MHHVDETRVPHSVTAIEGQRAVWIAGPQCLRYEAVGEFQNPDTMRRVVAALQGRTDTIVAAWLIPEPSSSHDTGPVLIWMLGGRVGYLPRELAAYWHPVLSRLHANYGCPLACQASLDPPSAANHGGFGVVVWLPPLPTPAVAPASQRSPVAPPPLPPVSTREPTSKRDPSPKAAAAVDQLSPAKLEELREELARTNTELQRAKRELTSVEEALEIQSFGFYAPKYGFESSAKYKMRLDEIRKEQAALIKEEKAAACDTKWTVGGSAAEGKKMVKQQAKLMLRAFHGECDAAIATVRYDNVTKLEQRITKSYDDINKLGAVQQVYISRRYCDLKLAELHLVHEHREKVQEEKEEQKRIKEQMREEQKAQEEIERAKVEAERAEAESAAALAKAKADLAAVAETSKQHDRLEGLVSRLEAELKEALDRKAKAIARAQLTRSGHVYVLSNIGSFGEGVFKIGMTRRLVPLERVEELGDASVPFPFDVHAIIYAADAPGLESALHKAFASHRVNVVNQRKEYFRVTLPEIQAEVQRLHGLVTFQLDPPAEEYRKTLAATAAPGGAISGTVIAATAAAE